jgi:hypothetical protein
MYGPEPYSTWNLQLSLEAHLRTMGMVHIWPSPRLTLVRRACTGLYCMSSGYPRALVG